MYTHATMPKLAFCSEKHNATVVLNFGNSKPIALLAGISAEHGLIHFKLYDRSVNQEKFVDFLDGVWGSMGGKDIAFFMDNFNVDKGSIVKEFMENRDITPIFNVPYAPQYNPIEVFSGHIKHPYKQLKLKKMIDKEKFDSKSLVI
jgi:transposase